MLSTFEKYEYLGGISRLKLIVCNIIILLSFLNGIFLLLAMSRIRVFSAILNTLQQIVRRSRLVFLIYLLSLFFFQCISIIIAGDSASPVAFSFSIYKILDSLIRSNSFKDFSLDYKSIFIGLLFLPYFLFVEFTLFSMLLSIIYHRLVVNFAKKKKKEKIRDKLTLKLFFRLTLCHVKDMFRELKLKKGIFHLQPVLDYKTGWFCIFRISFFIVKMMISEN